MDEHSPSIGQRLRQARLLRGLTLAQLGGLAGIAPTQISMWENGKRLLDRRSHISALAEALRISETELTGGPHLSRDREQSGPHAAVPALRAALVTNSLSAPAAGQARPLPELAAQVWQRIEPLRKKCDYMEMGAALPGVLDELHLHACQPADEATRILALEALVEACVPAAFMAKNLGYADLAHLAAVRAEEAALLLGDPVQQGKAAFLRIQTMPREGSSDRILLTAERAAAALEPHASSPLAMHILGILTLSAALAAAVLQRDGLAAHWLGEADRIAACVPDDLWDNWQSFSATNVALWRVAISVERGETGGAVLDLARTAGEDKLTARSRKADFLTDVGRGLAHDPKTRQEAVRWLRRAEDTAPQRVRNYAPAGQTVVYLRDQAIAHAGRELRGMAARMGIPH